MARSTNIVKPSPSNDPADKLLACVSWSIATLSQKAIDRTYLDAPGYYDACLEWFKKLSPAQQESVRGIMDAYSFPDRRKAAETWAAALPAAPKYPK